MYHIPLESYDRVESLDICGVTVARIIFMLRLFVFSFKGAELQHLWAWRKNYLIYSDAAYIDGFYSIIWFQRYMIYFSTSSGGGVINYWKWSWFLPMADLGRSDTYEFSTSIIHTITAHAPTLTIMVKRPTLPVYNDVSLLIILLKLTELDGIRRTHTIVWVGQ